MQGMGRHERAFGRDAHQERQYPHACSLNFIFGARAFFTQQLLLYLFMLSSQLPPPPPGFGVHSQLRRQNRLVGLYKKPRTFIAKSETNPLSRCRSASTHARALWIPSWRWSLHRPALLLDLFMLSSQPPPPSTVQALALHAKGCHRHFLDPISCRQKRFSPASKTTNHIKCRMGGYTRCSRQDKALFRRGCQSKPWWRWRTPVLSIQE